jgi:hypothetical protein
VVLSFNVKFQRSSNLLRHLQNTPNQPVHYGYG